MIAYQLDNVRRVTSGQTILNIDHLQIPGGRICGLLGANGAGKTTLLEILAFLEKPSSGTVIFQGKKVCMSERCLQALRRKVVMLDQFPILFSSTVYRNLEFGLKLRKIEKGEREIMIDRALDLVDMRPFKKAHATTLSGGETQRIALARAIALEPDVFLCDEPTSSIDRENQSAIIRLLRRINRENKNTIIFTSHDRRQAEDLAQNRIVLHQGRVTGSGYENVFSCKVLSMDTGRIRCEVGASSQILLQLTAENCKADGRQIWLDPHKLKFVGLNGDKDATGEENVFHGTIVQLRSNNTGIEAAVDVGLTLHIRLGIQEYGVLQPVIGDIVAVKVTSEAVRFF